MFAHLGFSLKSLVDFILQTSSTSQMGPKTHMFYDVTLVLPLPIVYIPPSPLYIEIETSDGRDTEMQELSATDNWGASRTQHIKQAWVGQPEVHKPTDASSFFSVFFLLNIKLFLRK